MDRWKYKDSNTGNISQIKEAEAAFNKLSASINVNSSE